MRHRENELGVVRREAARGELTAAAETAQPSVLIIPVFAKVFAPLKLNWTSLSPMAVSLIVLWATVPAWQLNSIAAAAANVMWLERTIAPSASRRIPMLEFNISLDWTVPPARSNTPYVVEVRLFDETGAAGAQSRCRPPNCSRYCS